MKRTTPPYLKFPLRILSFLKRYDAEYGLTAELEMEFRHKAEKMPLVRALLWFWGQVIFAGLVYGLRALQSGGALIFNDLKVTLRQLRKHKSHALINIVGLAVGMSCCLLVLLFVREEMSYDRFHRHAVKIFRITETIKRAAEDYYSIRVQSWIGPGMKETFPEVEDAVRIVRFSGIVSHGEKRFAERLFYTDPSFFDVFSFSLEEGDPSAVLDNPDSLLITRAVADKYFGTRDAVGKTLTIDGRYDFVITGILADVPSNSHIKFDFLASFDHVRRIFGERRFNAGRISTYTYVRLNNPESSAELEEKSAGFFQNRKGKEYAAHRILTLQPLTAIHLNSHGAVELENNSRIQYTYVLTSVALLILLIACVNYINLTTARASRRAREVGVRKVVGADRRRLFQQFIVESVTCAGLALVLAVVFSHFILPLFNHVMDRSLTMSIHVHPLLHLGFIGLALLAGWTAGCYPAFLLASFQPAEIVKGKITKNRLAGLVLRKGLVVFQFSLAVIFIIGMLTVNRQMEYLRNKDLGFNRNQVLVLPPPLRLEMGYEGLKAELLRHPAVLEVTASTGNPGFYPGIPFHYTAEGSAESEPVRLDYMSVDHDYFRFFAVEFIEGRGFSSSIPSDTGKALILNEAAVKRLGWESALGKRLKEVKGEMSGRVIGVIKDYHNVSLHENIHPAVFHVDPGMFGQLAVRVAPGRFQEAVAYLKTKWSEWAPFNIFYYSRLNEDLEKMYAEERKMSLVFKIASGLSVLIACLGLLALSVHMADMRTKEIGIRKTLGASASGIVKLLCRDFVGPILLADLIAWPVIFFFMKRWLNNFAFHVSLPIWLFVGGGGIALAISLVTIGYQSLKAASADPVKTLRYE